jgi:hypothetical protein
MRRARSAMRGLEGARSRPSAMSFSTRKPPSEGTASLEPWEASTSTRRSSTPRFAAARRTANSRSPKAADCAPAQAPALRHDMHRRRQAAILRHEALGRIGRIDVEILDSGVPRAPVPFSFCSLSALAIACRGVSTFSPAASKSAWRVALGRQRGFHLLVAVARIALRRKSLRQCRGKSRDRQHRAKAVVVTSTAVVRQCRPQQPQA